MIARLVRKHGRGKVPVEEINKELGRLYARYILLDWRGFDVPFAPDTAERTLCDPAYRKILDHVTWAATQVGERDLEFVEDAEKN